MTSSRRALSLAAALALAGCAQPGELSGKMDFDMLAKVQRETAEGRREFSITVAPAGSSSSQRRLRGF